MTKEITKNNPYRCLYTSSYDRGLEHLLKMWPDVKKAVPEAELHIYYGWQLFDQFYKGNPGGMAWKSKIEELMKHDGIVHHGRVSQPEIIKETKKSGLWTYPTHFGEINCISAQKAQAFGAIPVVIDYAALQTTVQFGVKVQGDVYEPVIQETYKKELIRALKDHAWQEKVREPMMKWAKEKFSWENTAKQWDAEFKGKGYDFDFTSVDNQMLRIVNGETGEVI